MSNAKYDLMKEINAKVARKKQLAKQVSKQKTVAKWVADFFVEFEKGKKLSEGFHGQSLATLALKRLTDQVRTLDRRCWVSLNHDNETIEIQWSEKFILANQCEAVLNLDAPSAFFESAMED